MGFPHEQTIWLDGRWWLLFWAGLLVASFMFVNWLWPIDPAYGPADSLVASIPRTFVAVLLAVALFVIFLLSAGALGFEFGMRG